MEFFERNFFFLTSIFEPLYFLKSCPIFHWCSLYSQNTIISFEYRISSYSR